MSIIKPVNSINEIPKDVREQFVAYMRTLYPVVEVRDVGTLDSVADRLSMAYRVGRASVIDDIEASLKSEPLP